MSKPKQKKRTEPLGKAIMCLRGGIWLVEAALKRKASQDVLLQHKETLANDIEIYKNSVAEASTSLKQTSFGVTAKEISATWTSIGDRDLITAEALLDKLQTVRGIC